VIQALWKVLGKLGVPEVFNNSMTRENDYSDGELLEGIDVKNGLRQGYTIALICILVL